VPGCGLIGSGLICLSEDGLLGGGLAAVDALTGPRRLFEGDAAHGGLGLFLDFCFAIGAAAPMRKREAFLDGNFELAVILRLGRVRIAKIESALEKRLLNFDKQLLDYACNSLLRHRNLPFAAGTVASR